MVFENLQLEERGTTVVVRVNRPKALNALNSQVINELSELLDAFNGRKDIRAVVLTGAGEKAFIAGADISEMAGMSQAVAMDFARRGQAVTLKLEQLNVPVIAAVNGFALGGGCEIALGCDFIVASTAAVFGQPEVCLGLITGFGGGVRLADFVGWPMARELIYTGRRVDANEALRIGLVNRVVEPARLLDEAVALADAIGANSPRAIRKVKAVMFKIRSEAALVAKLELEARAFSSVFTSHDQREGTTAFLEKRKARFTGE